MKKLLALLATAVFALTVFAAETPVDSRTLLTTSTDDNGIKTDVRVGRVQADPAKDGTITLTVFPVVIKSVNGTIVSEQLDTANGFPVALTAQQYAGLSTLVKAAYDAAHP